MLRGGAIRRRICRGGAVREIRRVHRVASTAMRRGEWVLLSSAQLEADRDLGEALERFTAPPGPAGAAAAEWLREGARTERGHIATYVLLEEGEILAFHSLGMGEVELRTQHRRRLGAGHPRQGAVVVLWLARAAGASVPAEEILTHALGIARRAATHVGAAVLALDPFDEETERFWRGTLGFRASLTRRTDSTGASRARLWMPLFPEEG